MSLLETIKVKDQEIDTQKDLLKRLVVLSKEKPELEKGLKPAIENLIKSISSNQEALKELLKKASEDTKELKDNLTEIQESISKSKETFMNGFKAINDTLGKMVDEMDLDSKIRNLCQGHWDGDNFVVPAETQIDLVKEARKDIIWSRDEYNQAMDAAKKFFIDLNNPIALYAWDDFQGIQYGFHLNPELRDFIEELASERNTFCQDWLIYDAFMSSKFDSNPDVRQACFDFHRKIYDLVTDKSKLSLNEMYGEAGPDYNIIAKSRDPYMYVYQHGLDPIEVMKAIEANKIDLTNSESAMVEHWLVKTVYEKLTNKN